MELIFGREKKCSPTITLDQLKCILLQQALAEATGYLDVMDAKRPTKDFILSVVKVPLSQASLESTTTADGI